MTFAISFQDEGQDLLEISCSSDTGEILSAEPCHNALYADGHHFIDVDQLFDNRMVWYRDKTGKKHCFKWPMVKLEQDGQTLAEVVELEDS